ncbi:MAG: hypothetical protein JKY03_14120 [Aureispira sp.]|nr:hypothetical protein [Aureispira sp.]
MEILDDYKEPQRDDFEGFVPYISLRNEEVGDVLAILDKNKVEFKLKKIMGSTNSTFLVSLSATQLSHSTTLIYIRDKTKIKIAVDVILDEYYEGVGKIHVEELAEKEAKIAAQNAVENKQKKWTFFNLAVLFLLIVLIWSFAEFYYL